MGLARAIKKEDEARRGRVVSGAAGAVDQCAEDYVTSGWGWETALLSRVSERIAFFILVSMAREGWVKNGQTTDAPLFPEARDWDGLNGDSNHLIRVAFRVRAGVGK